jgi:hypothetical protein
MTDFKTDPVVLQRGLPPEQRNGMYGQEPRLIALGVGERFTAVVTFEVSDIRSSEKEQTEWPVVSLAHIEPIFDTEGITTVRGVQEAAYKERTGANQLNFDGIGDPVPEAAGDRQAEEDAAFDAADPKKKPAAKK